MAANKRTAGMLKWVAGTYLSTDRSAGAAERWNTWIIAAARRQRTWIIAEARLQRTKIFAISRAIRMRRMWMRAMTAGWAMPLRMIPVFTWIILGLTVASQAGSAPGTYGVSPVVGRVVSGSMAGTGALRLGK